jgi:hypothetical protein
MSRVRSRRARERKVHHGPPFMTWKDEPATENQLGHLRRLGYEPDRPLTKGEAAQLISDFEGLSRGPVASQGSDDLETAGLSAYRLRVRVENARRVAAQGDGRQLENPRHLLEVAVAERQEFWADTCSEADKMHLVCMQVLALHKQHGCRFAVPTGEQVQAILDSLDFALPEWDRDHPELFYQTLELNFPELLRHQTRP